MARLASSDRLVTHNGAIAGQQDMRTQDVCAPADEQALAPEADRSRIAAAERRDAIAEEHDVAAIVRDLEADQRDAAMARLDVASQLDDDAQLSGSELVIRNAGARKRATERREQAAAYRLLVAEDRRSAEQDREQAARERRLALLDREALLLEVQRERHRRQQAMERQHDAETLAHSLLRSLSPPQLPHVDGLDVAVHHEPFAAEQVGGDFYDLFELATGRLGFFFGDVCGKGAHAAVVTALARYTMRTAAMLHEAPTAILRDLNAALLMERGEHAQTCTAVYGDIAIRRESADVTVAIAIAGHPAPLIVRSHGAVESATARGTVLGAIDEPALETCEVALAPGDALVMYSDGALDTQIDGIRTDEAHIVRLLSAGPPQASARALLDRLLDALRRSDRPLRDDVAIMALQRTQPRDSVSP